MLRLERPSVPLGHARLLPGLGDLHGLDLGGRRLLLAIGARQLQRAVSLTPAALHHARILPSAEALAEAMAAGLAPERVACLRPTAQGMVERALCRHWRIELVLCRRSGGPGEALWHTITAAEGIGLLLLERPAEPSGIACLGRTALLERIGTPK